MCKAVRYGPFDQVGVWVDEAWVLHVESYIKRKWAR